MDVSDEEEDEEVSAPPPVEGAQEEKEEQGDQQVEGEDSNSGIGEKKRENSFYTIGPIVCV